MEIFQTIWTALTTENELLINIQGIPLTFIEVTCIIYLSIAILNLNISRNKIISFIISLSIVSILSTFLLPQEFAVIINFIYIPLFTIFVFKLNFFKGLLIEFLPMIIMLISETIWLNLGNLAFGISANDILTIPIYKLSMSLLNYISLYIIYLIAKKYKLNIKLLDSLPKKSKIILTSNLIMGFIAIVTQFYLIAFYVHLLPYFITIIALLSLLAYFFISMYSLTNTSKLIVTKENLEQEKEHNRILKASQDELHGFRHDFGNIMCTISGYIQVKDMNGLTKYYSQIQKDINKVNNLGALNPDSINNPAVFVLISSKYNKALELGIDMNINVFLDLNNLNMKIYEFTRILGILLDNAIEATKECDEKIINLEIRKDTNRNRQILLIENTYNNKDIDTEKIYEKNYSTKEGNSGLGLWEVRQILKRNTNLNLFTSKNDKLFKQQLEMYNI